ncbi:MAG: dephospho-CoA kinase [Clostridia bacterium]|nr:dephospho-CoA kinase [Clostridia bacterium]
MRDFRIIGLTGPSGAGKSTVAALFAEWDIPVIDADRVYHQLLIPPSPCLDALTEEFSDGILAADGTLDRVALSALVFEDSDKGRARRTRLNEITHRFVIEKSEQLLAQYRVQGKPAAVIDAPLLIEAGMHRGCDFTVCVLAPEDLRVRRLTARDQKSEAAILARIHAQPTEQFYLSHTDAAVYNTGDIDALRAQLQDVLRRAEVLM